MSIFLSSLGGGTVIKLWREMWHWRKLTVSTTSTERIDAFFHCLCSLRRKRFGTEAPYLPFEDSRKWLSRYTDLKWLKGLRETFFFLIPWWINETCSSHSIYPVDLYYASKEKENVRKHILATGLDLVLALNPAIPIWQTEAPETSTSHEIRLEPWSPDQLC